MLSKYRPIVLCLLCFCLALPLRAQNEGIRLIRAGIISSFKAHSISLITSSNRKESTFNAFNLSLDTYGIYNQRTIYPGVKFTCMHNAIIYADRLAGNMVRYVIYAGGGGVLGYVKDYAPSIRNHGGILGLATNLGAIFAFPDTRFELGLDCTAELALQLRKMEEANGDLGLSWYANGVLRALIPQISIYYRF